MKVGDLVKFTDITTPEDNDIGIIFNIKGRDITLYWAKTGEAYAKIDRLLCTPKYFEIIEQNS